MPIRTLRFFLLALSILWSLSFPSLAQESREYALGPGDVVRIQVFQNPDLNTETRVSETGAISFPLVGQVTVGGLSLSAAERALADALLKGGFLRNPQITIALLQIRGSQISVLGQVNRPGRFPLETSNVRLSDMLAAAGGAIAGNTSFAGGSDVAIVTGTRDGKPFRQEIDIAALYLDDRPQLDIQLRGGDTIYVPRAAVYYIYGEAQRAGVYRIERGMTVMQALATGGGPTARGTEKRVRLHRRKADGSVEETTPQLSDQVQPGDVLYVRESLF